MMATFYSPKYYLFPFAEDGEVTVIPDDDLADGTVSYELGWGADYEEEIIPGPDNTALNFSRENFNGLFFAMTGNLKAYRTFGAPEFITPDQNGGVPFPYDAGAVTRYSDGETYLSLYGDNEAIPTGSNWVPMPYGTAPVDFDDFIIDGSGFLLDKFVSLDGSIVITETGVAGAKKIDLSAAGAGLNQNSITFVLQSTQAGNFIIPAGYTLMFVKASGGGGSGGGADAFSPLNAGSFEVGAGGGSGGYLDFQMAVSGGQQYNYFIGVGGLGMSGVDGNDGNSTTLALDSPATPIMTCEGGKGGQHGEMSLVANVVTGGDSGLSTLNGVINAHGTGEPGGMGVALAVGNNFASGQGGSTPLGAGGDSVQQTGASGLSGNPGINGGGGSGGTTQALTGISTPGGDGGIGKMIITLARVT